MTLDLDLLVEKSLRGNDVACFRRGLSLAPGGGCKGDPNNYTIYTLS
jgi:hypothetical protein